jgi:hypothetical protein
MVKIAKPNSSPGQKPSVPKLSGAANASPGTKIKAPIATSSDYTGTGLPAGKPAPKTA